MIATTSEVAVRVHRFDGRALASSLRFDAVTAAGLLGRATAERAWAAVGEEFAAVDRALSRFRADSELIALDQAAIAGRDGAASWRLRRAVVACDRAHRVTEGRFDPRVLGQLDAWGYAGVPLDDPRALTHLAGPDRIVSELDRAAVRLPHPLDLGGIGKGLAVRWAADRVRTLGVERFLIDAGGDLIAEGPSPEGGPWRVGIEDPAGGDDLAVVALEAGGIATSSVRRLQWTQDGRSRHHLVDPATGEPAAGGLQAVTVAGPDPAWAEVWSKALFVAGRSGIAELARSRGLEAWWVDDAGALAMTAAARQRTMWVAAEAPVEGPVDGPAS